MTAYDAVRTTTLVPPRVTPPLHPWSARRSDSCPDRRALSRCRWWKCRRLGFAPVNL